LRAALAVEASGGEGARGAEGETAYAQGTPEDDEAREGRAEREPPEARALLPRRPPRRRGDPLRRARADAGSLRGGARQDPHEAARHGRAVRRDGARRGPGPRRGAGRGGPAGPRVRGRRLLRPLPRRQGIPVHAHPRSEEHTSELQSRFDLVCRLLLEKKKTLT